MNKILLVILLAFNGIVIAGSLKTGNPERKPKTQVLMTELQSKKINRVSEMMADEKYGEAKVELEKMLAQAKSQDGYVKAVIYQLLGHINSQQENYAEAGRNFNAAVELDALPNRTHFDLMLGNAQFMMIGEKYQDALKALDAYFAVTDEIPDRAFALKANMHLQLNQFREAKGAMKQAIELADAPKENWYQTLMSIHYELKEYKEVADVLEILIQMRPDKKDYWKQLSSIYFTLKLEEKSLAVFELAYEKGLLTEENELLQLYKLYSINEVPYKAGQVFQKALDEEKIKPTFKHWKQLGAIWYEAKELEKALAAYAKASQYAEDGEMDFTRAYLYIDLEDYENAKKSLQSGLKKGGLDARKTGTLWFMLGVSEANLSNFNAARNALNKAKEFESSRENAIQWLSHLETLERRQQLADNN